MRDEQSVRRLEEMGIDVYAPRGARRIGNVEQASASTSRVVESSALRVPERVRARIVLLARAEQPRAKALLAHIARALAFARIDSAVESTADESRLGGAAGLVVFGDALVRQAGAVLSADRRKDLQWVTAADIADVAAGASTKRALWGELRGMIRGLGARH
jgi:hypothetical protein